jgi:DNA mismatch repair protein MutS2
MATTHYAELKMFALDTAGVQNAGSEFDIETLRPTYRLIVGVPGRSNAFLISERLGLPGEVIEGARRHMSSEQQRFDTVLTQLEDLKLELKSQEEEIERLRHAAAYQLADAEKRRDALIRQGEQALADARKKAGALADEVRSAAYGLMDEMKRLEKDKRLAGAQKLQRARQIARREADSLSRRSSDGEITAPPEYKPLKRAEVGQEVWIPEMRKAAVVTAPPDKGNQVGLRIGAIKTKMPLGQLAARSGQTGASPNATHQGNVHVQRSADVGVRTASTELYLLGKTVDEALLETDQFIDRAMMNGLETVYLVHGRGTGALRAAIGRHLKCHRSVRAYRLGRYGEGEDGVTVVELK